MPYLGAHLSAAGGPSRAAAAARQLGCEALQMFLSSPGRWRMYLPTPQIQGEFRTLAALPPLRGRCFAHTPYLLNLASEEEELRCRSLAGLVTVLKAADALGLAGVVLHPGSAGRSARQEAMARCRAALAEALERAGEGEAALLLENVAGSGGQLGRDLRELAALVPEAKSGRRRTLGVCLDLAHLWAAGYDVVGPGWETALGELSECWGVGAPHLLHANDTPVPCGSRKDRHLPPGEGVLGERVFRRLLEDPRFADTPLVVEIPPGPRQQFLAHALARLRSWRGEGT